VHVPYSTRHDKLDECKNKPALPQLATIGDNIMAKKRHHAAPIKLTQESKSGVGATRY
jgi:hypothetical protein